MGDYDRKPMQPASTFLRLKSKGEEVRVRIATSPYRELKVWPAEKGGTPLTPEQTMSFTPGQWMRIMSTPDWNVSEVFHFVVIDRADQNAKIFTTTGGVYGKIRDFATNPEWGNPTSYDLTILRTENPGKDYYKVTPSPNKSDLTVNERAAVDKLDLRKLLAAALPAGDPQPDDFTDTDIPEPLPWEETRERVHEVSVQKEKEKEDALKLDDLPAAGTEDDVITDIGDEPINLDDIPFSEDPSTSKKDSEEK